MTRAYPATMLAMHNTLHSLLRPLTFVSLALMLGMPAVASSKRTVIEGEVDLGGHAGQEQTQAHAVTPEPLPADHPRAKQAAAVVMLLLDGNRAAVIKVLRTEGTPEFVTGPDFEGIVDKQLGEIGKKGYAIGEFQTGLGADVVVELTSSSTGKLLFVVRFTMQPPHRIEGFARAVMG